MANILPQWTDAQLIMEIRAGGRRREIAWEYIYKAWRGIYLAPVLAENGLPEEADELLGEVFVSVEKQILKPDFEMKVAKLSTYLTTCVRNAWVSKRIKENAINNAIDELIPDKHLPSQDPNAVAKEIEADYFALLLHFDEKCKTALTMSRQGYSMQEIAQALGLKKEQSAKNLKSDCHRKLLDQLDIT